MKIGLIGLGIMGKPMAKNVLKAGYDLTVYDLNKSAMEELGQSGACLAENIGQIGANCDVILTMLPNSPQVKEVVLGEGGLIEHMKAGTIVVDMSSIDPTVSREIAAELEKIGVEMLDAPVSGGEPKAVDGTLSFMVGGKETVFDQLKDILSCMGSSVVLCGDIGAGNVTKLCNQVIVAVNIAAVAEALTMGEKAGVSPEKIYQAIRGGLAGSTVLDAKAPMMMAENFAPGFRVDLHIKDLNNVMSAAQATKSNTPMANKALEILRWVSEEDGGSQDHSAMYRYYQA